MRKILYVILLGHEQALADDGLLEFGSTLCEGKVKPAVPDLPYPAALHLAGAESCQRIAVVRSIFSFIPIRSQVSLWTYRYRRII